MTLIPKHDQNFKSQKSALMTLIFKHDQNFKVPEVQKTYLYLWEEKKQSSEGKINLLCIHKYTIASVHIHSGLPLWLNW